MEPHALQKYCNLILTIFYAVFIIILLAFSTWYYETRKIEFGTSGEKMF